MSTAVTEDNHAIREAIRAIAESRRSVRQFLAEPVPDADVQEILRLTGLAPSASNVQTWRWAVVRTPDMIERLVPAMAGANQATLANAPVGIVLYSDGQQTLDSLEEIMHPGMGAEEGAKRAAGMRENLSKMGPERLADWAKTQTFIALGQIVLIARAMGYDTATMGGFDQEAIKETLGLPATATVTSVIALGKRSAEGFPHHRYPVDRITTWF